MNGWNAFLNSLDSRGGTLLLLLIACGALVAVRILVPAQAPFVDKPLEALGAVLLFHFRSGINPPPAA